jgi:hypothetical protein
MARGEALVAQGLASAELAQGLVLEVLVPVAQEQEQEQVALEWELASWIECQKA